MSRTRSSPTDPLGATSARVWALWAFLTAASFGAAWGAPATAGDVSETPQDRGDYQIGPEDVLDIVVWDNATLSRTVPVRPDGMISLPLLNDIKAAGLTPMELRDVLTRRLKEYMPSPEVSVVVREVHSFKVTVMGEVKEAGRYELRSRATVLDAIAQAKGFTEFASPKRVVVLRRNGRGLKRIPVDCEKAISDPEEQANLPLQPGDVVMVP